MELLTRALGQYYVACPWVGIESVEFVSINLDLLLSAYIRTLQWGATQELVNAVSRQVLRLNAWESLDCALAEHAVSKRLLLGSVRSGMRSGDDFFDSLSGRELDRVELQFLLEMNRMIYDARAGIASLAQRGGRTFDLGIADALLPMNPPHWSVARVHELIQDAGIASVALTNGATEAREWLLQAGVDEARVELLIRYDTGILTVLRLGLDEAPDAGGASNPNPWTRDRITRLVCKP